MNRYNEFIQEDSRMNMHELKYTYIHFSHKEEMATGPKLITETKIVGKHHVRVR